MRKKLKESIIFRYNYRNKKKELKSLNLKQIPQKLIKSLNLSLIKIFQQ